MRIVTHFFAAVAVFASIGIMSGGCVEAEGRIFIETIYGTDEQGICQTDPDVILQRGFIDCDSNGCYIRCGEDSCSGILCMLVRNQMTSSIDNASNNNNVETSIVVLHSYDVRYIADGVDLSAADATIQITVSAQPDETSQPVGILVLTNEAADVIASSAPVGSLDVIMGVRFYGRTTGGLEVETPETFIGVTVAKF